MSEKNKITRRQFVKRAAVVGAAAIGGTGIIGAGKVVVDKLSRDETLAQRDRERPRNGAGWFIPAEHILVGALAALIVPSDGAGAGAKEADVVNTIDRLLAKSRSRQLLYAPGLLGFDELAQHEYGSGFAELTEGQQLRLLQLVDRTHQTATTGGLAVTERLRRKTIRLYHQWPAPGAWDGFGAILQLFPQLIEDVKEAFYTSTVAWDWLGYDGPPFPRGYFGRVNCSPKAGHERV